MQCKDVMKDGVECLLPNDTVQAAAQRMRDRNIGFLPICDRTKKVVGTVTDRDIAIRAVAGNKPPTTPISDVMSKDVIACRPTDDVEKATELMGQHQKSRMLCTDPNGQLLGVISLSDIAQQGEEMNASETMRRITTREAHVH